MWTKHSYKHFRRYIDYFSTHEAFFEQMATLPSIVSHSKIQAMRQELKGCEKSERLLLHCGDCAQPFQHVDRNVLSAKVSYFKQLRQLVETTHSRPVTLIGRIAGQYAKPRSNEFTHHNGKQIHNYKGDNVNSEHHNDREPDTRRLLQGYYNSVVTHNHLANHFGELFTSHEGLILPYEAALTQEVGRGQHYCLSAHMLWIGERTRQLDGAHVEFFRGVRNPIGIKVSNKIADDQFLHLVQKLNPENQQGKLIVIVRMGHSTLGSKLNHLIEIKHKHNLNFLFASDPMHGNTYQTKQHKIKTRHYDHIMSEIKIFEKFMKKSHLPFGLSLESTHEDVTECIGGHYPFQQSHLEKSRYKSKCDPRLNPAQMQRLIREVSFT